MSKIAIVGGGVIGLFTAWYLRKTGAEITVIDRGDMIDGCSFGNAGLIVPSHVVPLASPGMLRKGIKNMFNPNSSLAVRMAPDSDLIRWYMRFAGAASANHVEKSIPVLKELSLLSKSLYSGLKESAQLDFPMWHKGLLMLYQSAKIGDELMEEAEIARKAGLEVSSLSASEIQSMEFDAQPNVSGGVHYKSDDHLDPSVLMKSLLSNLEKSGVTFARNCAVREVITSRQKASAIETENGTFEFDQLIITAGFWSTQILKQLKINLDVQPGKGYSFKVKTVRPIHFPALLADANVAVTPFGSDLTQFGGGMELGYGGLKIRQARIDQIIRAVGQFYPSEAGLNIEQDQIWQGHRPCSFDGLPFIGRIPAFQNIFVGTGHSMMGLTLAPATGKLLSELICEEKLSLDLTPFRIDR
jgi:D-amino-acid dehydrogenase